MPPSKQAGAAGTPGPLRPLAGQLSSTIMDWDRRRQRPACARGARGHEAHGRAQLTAGWGSATPLLGLPRSGPRRVHAGLSGPFTDYAASVSHDGVHSRVHHGGARVCGPRAACPRTCRSSLLRKPGGPECRIPRAEALSRRLGHRAWLREESITRGQPVRVRPGSSAQPSTRWGPLRGPPAEGQRPRLSIPESAVGSGPHGGGAGNTCCRRFGEVS